MTDELKIAREYLLPPPESFWEWRDQGEAITWIDGKTITFRPELALVLQHLAPMGLPPLGALLLLFAATRDSWTSPPDDLSVMAGWLSNSESARDNVNALYGVIEELEKVRALDAELRTTPESKAILAEVVFSAPRERTTPEEAAVIVTYVEHDLREVLELPDDTAVSLLVNPSDAGTSYSRLLRDLRCLHLGLQRLTPERLQLRRETGLDELIQPADLDLPMGQRIRALLADLEDDPELSGLAKLAHELMAAVTLPRAVVDREELQVGGVSDITNRGPLDRLLLSELAHDDFALAVRVAMNEALYLRRESPPRTPHRERAILLDAGIRTWGVPRVFETAVALALAATAEQHTNVSVYRANCDAVDPVDLTTRDGLLEHLSALEPEMHPGAALAAFEKLIESAENAAEPVLVSAEDVVADQEFLADLSGSTISDWHLATVNRDGRFRLIERTVRVRKLHRESLLNLDDLFKEPPRAATRLIDRQLAADLPAILYADPFPLYLSHNTDADRMWTVSGFGVLSLTNDRRLTLWTDRRIGAAQIADNIPRGNLWWSTGQPQDSIVQAVVGSRAPGGSVLLKIDLQRWKCDQVPLEVDGFVGICSHNGVLFAVSPGKVEVLSPASGEIVQTLTVPEGLEWGTGRFFVDIQKNNWYALAYDGRTAQLEQVTVPSGKRLPKLLAMFDRAGFDGPFGLTTLLEVFDTASGEARPIKHRLGGYRAIWRISPDARYLTLDSNEPQSGYPRGKTVVIDVETLQVDAFHKNAHNAVEPAIRETVNPVNIRHRFNQICVDQRGLLTLISRKRQPFSIECHSIYNQVILHAATDNHIQVPHRTFKDVKIGTDVGYRLSKATWDDGSAAFLDSRGLLHLRSSDRSLPEVSIVLKDGALSGWCSDGRTWGTRYFTGSATGSVPSDVFETVIKAFCERLR